MKDYEKDNSLPRVPSFASSIGIPAAAARYAAAASLYTVFPVNQKPA
ncbi:MAG: hypothetical protein ACLS3C_00840 [Oscillospiraceae bacterium]